VPLPCVPSLDCKLAGHPPPRMRTEISVADLSARTVGVIRACRARNGTVLVTLILITE